MPDSAEQLQRIYLAGFELQTFERYPKCIGVMRDNCVALLVPGVDGLQILGTPGWRMGEVMGVLTEREGRKVFQAKTEIVEATPERLALLQRFREDLAESMKREDVEIRRMSSYSICDAHIVLLTSPVLVMTSLPACEQRSVSMMMFFRWSRPMPKTGRWR